jgi:hypothetical protein
MFIINLRKYIQWSNNSQNNKNTFDDIYENK